MNNVISLMVSADWHIGATNPYRFKDELMKLVKVKLYKEVSLDMFVVSGDIFDTKEYLSSDSVKVFFLIMAELLELTKNYNTEFRFIEGTRTHDALQLGTLQIVFENLLKNPRVKFIEEVTEEELLGTKILYIPEEYVIDSKEYYKEYIKDTKRYDFIFGHGNTDLMWYMKSDKQTKYSSAPVFNVDDITPICRYAYWGHFHYRIETGEGNRFKSIGPVSRWEFGKTGDCGLYYVEYDKTSGLAIEEYIENKYAPILETVIVNIKQDYDLSKLNQKVDKKLEPILDKSDKVALIVNIDSNLDTFISMRDFLLSYYGKKDKVSLLLKPIGKKEDEKEEEQTSEEVLEEKPYLYDKSLRDEAKIASFIKRNKGANISLERILEVIQKQDTKISTRED